MNERRWTGFQARLTENLAGFLKRGLFTRNQREDSVFGGSQGIFSLTPGCPACKKHPEVFNCKGLCNGALAMLKSFKGRAYSFNRFY
jgi:hypothetical protein